MSSEARVVIGLGELLWDLMPAGAQLGGAPSNFAYHATALGDRGIVASRVGGDDLGRRAIDRLRRAKVDASYVQLDDKRPTGTVTVHVDEDGQPRYSIAGNVAWDFFQMTDQWRSLAARADAICFGSLAQRSPESRRVVREFLSLAPEGALIIFDVNLRQPFYGAELLSDSLALARVAKLNQDELKRVAGLLGLDAATDEARAARLLSGFDLEMVCVTRGGGGSLMVGRDGEAIEHAGFTVRVADTVGAGDAFAAALAHYVLRGAPLGEVSEQANRLGAWVASRVGAMPQRPDPKR
jgi:fructokinase